MTYPDPAYREDERINRRVEQELALDAIEAAGDFVGALRQLDEDERQGVIDYLYKLIDDLEDK